MPESWPRRPRLVVGNWKMNKTAAEGAALAREMAALSRSGELCEVALCPPFTALHSVAKELQGTGLRLGAQDLHPEPRGPFTGEIAGSMLVESGCRFVIVGHSERRHGMGEDDDLVARKLRAAQRAGLFPIVCIGETLQERGRGEVATVLGRQVRTSYQGLSEGDALATLIAYEPVWAIGTGRVASAIEARDAHRIIREAIDLVVARGVGERLTILYGGSVSPDNAQDLFQEPGVDGALVGGASLEGESFWPIVRAASEEPRATRVE